MGRQVLLLERLPFPRPHVGEAMTPAVLDLLDVSGARAAVEALGVVHTPRARVRWVDGKVNLVASPSGRPGFTVDRARFDGVLLEQARSAGVAVMHPASASSLRRTKRGWQISLSGNPGPASVFARFLADATGRRGLLRGRRIRTSPPTLCLDGLWTYEHADNRDVQVEARSEGWYWAAPLPGHAVRVMAFTDPDWLRGRRVRRADLDRFYCNLLLKTDILSALKGPSLKGHVIARDATCYFDDAPIDESFIKVGEAAFAIDPLSSSGVQKALQTALAGSVASNTILGGGDVAAAIDFYSDNQRRSVLQHALWTARHYREHWRYREEAFWRRRALQPIKLPRPPSREQPKAAAGEMLRLARGVRVVRVPCAVGDRVEMREAVSHPGLTRPIAFLNGADLVPIVTDLISPVSAARQRPGQSASDELRKSTVSWLVRHGVLEATDPKSISAES